jgi:hypothetical protein
MTGPNSLPLSRTLSVGDRRLLTAMQRIVPAPERDEWTRSWYGELWHARERRRGSGLALGLIRDALWLRGESLRTAHDGTAALCLASLAALCALSALAALLAIGSWHGLEQRLSAEFFRFMLQAPFVVFVACATSPRRHMEQGALGRKVFWLRRQLFFAAKMALVLVLTFLVSMDVCQPIHAAHPMTAGLLQIFCFVLLSLLGLRWSFADQHQRCKQCLRSLRTPARVGRPSHNLLEWNGTELQCRDGHGQLSVPEMETSWCQASRWSYQEKKLA